MPKGTKTIRSVNKDKVAKKNERIAKAKERASKARQRKDKVRKRIAEKTTKKAELEAAANSAASEEVAAAFRRQIEDLEAEIKKEDAEMQDAEDEENNFQKEENDAEAEDVTEEMVIENGDGPDDLIKTTENSDHITIITALLKGMSVKNLIDPVTLSHGIGLEDTQAIVAYKSSGPSGKVGIVCDTQVPKCPIFRIMKSVVVDKDVPDLVESRRAGKVKDPVTKKKWEVSDVDDIIGIAIAVPPGYSGNAEDLVLPIRKYSGTEKDAMKARGESVPKQPDVQLFIQWKEEDADGKLTSWENRTGCRLLWKKNADLTLFNTATHFEGYFRKAGGKLAVRSLSPLEILSVGSSPSPNGTPDPSSTGTTEEPENEKPKPTGNAEEKKAARAEFKIDWCTDKNVDPEKMTDAELGSMMAAFKPFWEITSAA